MAEHRIELVQLFNAAKQPRHHFFEITRGLCAKTPVFLDERLLLFRVGVRKDGNIHHQLLAAWQKLVQRGIKGSNRDRKAVHGAKYADEVRALHRQ